MLHSCWNPNYMWYAHTWCGQCTRIPHRAIVSWWRPSSVHDALQLRPGPQWFECVTIYIYAIMLTWILGRQCLPNGASRRGHHYANNHQKAQHCRRYLHNYKLHYMCVVTLAMVFDECDARANFKSSLNRTIYACLAPRDIIGPQR